MNKYVKIAIGVGLTLGVGLVVYHYVIKPKQTKGSGDRSPIVHDKHSRKIIFT